MTESKKAHPLMSFRIRAGTIIGSEHQRKQVNNQEGFTTGRMEHGGMDYIWGVICDGCSIGLRNEVGAALLSNYLCREIPYLISSGSSVVEIPDQLFIAGLGYLRSLASHTAMGGPHERLMFVKDHLLCTVIGFITDGGTCVFFSAGDGVVMINDDVKVIDQKNKPIYMGYHLVDKAALKGLDGPLPLKFSTEAFVMDGVERFAICSDGMREVVVTDLRQEIWGHEHPLGLQRRLRVLRLQKKVLFSDDCTVIAVEKVETTEEGGTE